MPYNTFKWLNTLGSIGIAAFDEFTKRKAANLARVGSVYHNFKRFFLYEKE